MHKEVEAFCLRGGTLPSRSRSVSIELSSSSSSSASVNFLISLFDGMEGEQRCRKERKKKKRKTRKRGRRETRVAKRDPSAQKKDVEEKRRSGLMKEQEKSAREERCRRAKQTKKGEISLASDKSTEKKEEETTPAGEGRFVEC